MRNMQAPNRPVTDMTRDAPSPVTRATLPTTAELPIRRTLTREPTAHVSSHVLDIETPIAQAQVAAASKSTLLIIEDFDAIRHMLARHFEKSGCEVYSVSQVKEALSLAGALMPEIVIVDYDLARDDALKATRELRSMNPATCIILLGGPATDNLRDLAIASGASHFVPAGYDLVKIDSIIDRQIHDRQIADRQIADRQIADRQIVDQHLAAPA